jgi:hypothetical protein
MRVNPKNPTWIGPYPLKITKAGLPFDFQVIRLLHQTLSLLRETQLSFPGTCQGWLSRYLFCRSLFQLTCLSDWPARARPPKTTTRSPGKNFIIIALAPVDHFDEGH